MTWSLLLLALATPTTGVISGVVTSFDGAPLRDVIVTARSENLQGEQIVLTDASGAFSLQQLPPGRYVLVFELDRHKPEARADLVVHAGGTIWLRLDMINDSTAVCFGPLDRPAGTVDVRSNAMRFPVGPEVRRLVPLFAP